MYDRQENIKYYKESEMDNKQIRVLHCLGGMGRGGAPIFIINNMLELKEDNVVFDFLIRNDNCAFNQEIEVQNGRVYVMPTFPRHFIKNYIETKKFFKENYMNYDVVHVHANALIYMLPLRFAKKYGIRTRILHSHNTKSNQKTGKWIHLYNRRFIKKYANVFWRVVGTQENGCLKMINFR